jgi:dipeptidyl aminopeptidase/acylaminoacyl peptidase
MAFTINQPLDYDTTYNFTVQNAKTKKGTQVEKFSQNFSTKPKQIIYLAPSEQNPYPEFETSQLNLFNLTENQNQVLSPVNLFVLDYKISPKKQKIYFLAADLNTAKADIFLTDQQSLYELNLKNNKVKNLTHEKSYLNFNFTLAPDESKIALVRAKINQDKILSDRGIWILDLDSQKLTPFWFNNIVENQILFSPDSSALLGVDYNLGYVLVPLQQNPEQLVEFGLHQKSYGFSNFDNSLYFTTNKDQLGEKNFITYFSGKNEKQQLFQSDPSSFHEFIKPFNFSNKIALITKTNLEKYDFLIYDLKSNQTVFKLTDPDLNYEQFSISPNDKFAVIEVYSNQIDQNFGPTAREFIESVNSKLELAELYLLDLSNQKIENLELEGRKPSWL